MLYACVGAYTENPYYIEELGVFIHSIEELCYVLKENITGLEDSIMRSDICFYIEKELKLPELGRKLLTGIRQNAGLSGFVCTIFEAASYCNKEELRTIEKLLLENALLGDGGRRKVRGDFFLGQGKLLKALSEYDRALEMLTGSEDKEMISAVYHNKGTAYARMFFFKEAADNFLKAYETDRNDDSYTQYLASMRLGASREQYVEQVIDLQLDQEKVAKLEEKIGLFAEESRESREYKLVKKAVDERNAGNVAEYRRCIMTILDTWKKEYRNSMEVE